MASPASQPIKKQTAFLHAVKSGDVERVEQYYEEDSVSGVSLITPAVLGEALREAACENELDMVHLLISYKAPLNEQDDQGFSAIDFAAWHGNVAMVKTLLDAGASQDVMDEHGFTPSINAGRRGMLDEADKVRGLLKRYKDMPTLSQSDTHSKKALFSQEYYWRNALDNPKTWQSIGKIMDYFVRMGDPVGIDDLCKSNNAGVPWIFRAAECRAMDQVMPYLHAEGEYLQARHLVKEDGSANSLLNTLAETRQLSVIFTPQNLQGSSSKDIKAIYHAVPEQWRGQVKNLRSLVLAAERQQTPGLAAQEL